MNNGARKAKKALGSIINPIGSEFLLIKVE
jgi:hypothetical protein